MAVALRSVGVSPGARSASCVIVKPAGLTVDDLMIAHVITSTAEDTPGATSAPGGWTEIRQDAGADLRSALFWKIAVPADVDASDFTFTVDNTPIGDCTIGAISAWTGHDASSPINTNNGQYNASSTTVTSPAITPSVANCMILMLAGIEDNNTQSNYAIADDDPGGWAEAYDILTTEGSDCAAAMGYVLRPETTATGLGTATTSGAVLNVGQLVAIAPEVALIQQAVGDGTITPTGALNLKVKLDIGDGTITPTGALTAALRFRQAVGNGIITPIGALTFLPKIGVGNGTITPTGALNQKTKLGVGNGTITPAGALGLLVKLAVGDGTITPVGVLTSIFRRHQAVGDGTITPVGVLTSIFRVFQAVGDGTITPVGVLTSVLTPKFQALFVRIAFDTDPFAVTPTWTDVRADVLSMYTKRGRQHELDRIETGLATIQLLNVDGNYWPLNAGGSYYGKVLPGKKINVRAMFDGTIYDLYTGFIEAWEPSWLDQTIAVTTVRCADIGKRLSRFELNNAGEAQEASGVRVGNVLDELGWPAADRDLDTGQTTLKSTGAQVAVKAQSHLFLVQDTEVGIIFLAPDGHVQFQDRHARLKAPYTVSQATFGMDGAELVYRFLEPSYDDQFIYNDIRRTRVDGAEQTASDATSQGDYGKSTSNLTGLLMLLDTEAKDQCDFMLSQYKDPHFRIRGMELFPDKDPDNLYPKVLGYDISTRITLRLNEAHLDEDFHIEGIIHNWNRRSGLWSTKWQLSNASGVAYWAIGVAGFSEIGETTRLAY